MRYLKFTDINDVVHWINPEEVTSMAKLTERSTIIWIGEQQIEVPLRWFEVSARLSGALNNYKTLEQLIAETPDRR